MGATSGRVVLRCQRNIEHLGKKAFQPRVWSVPGHGPVRDRLTRHWCLKPLPPLAVPPVGGSNISLTTR